MENGKIPTFQTSIGMSNSEMKDMKRKFLIFAIYEKDENQGFFTLNSIYDGDFPTKKQAEDYMKDIAWSKLIGVTGIIEVFNDCGW